MSVRDKAEAAEWAVVDSSIERRMMEITAWLQENQVFEPNPEEMGAVERAYHFHRAKRRRRVQRRQESTLARLRFYLVLLVLAAATIALLFATWREIRQLFGI